MSTGQLLESLASVDSMIPAFKYPRKPHVLNHLTVAYGGSNRLHAAGNKHCLVRASSNSITPSILFTAAIRCRAASNRVSNIDSKRPRNLPMLNLVFVRPLVLPAIHTKCPRRPSLLYVSFPYLQLPSYRMFIKTLVKIYKPRHFISNHYQFLSIIQTDLLDASVANMAI